MKQKLDKPDQHALVNFALDKEIPTMEIFTRDLYDVGLKEWRAFVIRGRKSKEATATTYRILANDVDEASQILASQTTGIESLQEYLKFFPNLRRMEEIEEFYDDGRLEVDKEHKGAHTGEDGHPYLEIMDKFTGEFGEKIVYKTRADIWDKLPDYDEDFTEFIHMMEKDEEYHDYDDADMEDPNDDDDL